MLKSARLSMSKESTSNNSKPYTPSSVPVCLQWIQGLQDFPETSLESSLDNWLVVSEVSFISNIFQLYVDSDVDIDIAVVK